MTLHRSTCCFLFPFKVVASANTTAFLSEMHIQPWSSALPPPLLSSRLPLINLPFHWHLFLVQINTWSRSTVDGLSYLLGFDRRAN